jgi:hypothetical protein
MTADRWDEGTFTGAAVAQTRRLGRLTPEQRLEWLEAALRDADQAGILVEVRRRRQHAAMDVWRRGARPLP